MTDRCRFDVPEGKPYPGDVLPIAIAPADLRIAKMLAALAHLVASHGGPLGFRFAQAESGHGGSRLVVQFDDGGGDGDHLDVTLISTISEESE